MKKLILAALILIGSSATTFAQNAKVDASGNYVAIKTESSHEPAQSTGKTFTDNKGNKYPVMKSSKGKLFYVRTSKTGNEYKVYLKLEG